MNEHISTDVAIIGAGVAGALLAHRLASRGIKVLLIDACQTVDRADAVRPFRQASVKVPESA